MLTKDLLGLYDMPTEDILIILEAAKTMKKIVLASTKAETRLRGKTLANLFFENSTRTRISFELAAKYLGARVVNMSAEGSSVAKGETLVDTGKNIAVMGIDAIVVRHMDSGAPHLLSRHVDIPVINAGDGLNEHPTQALLDMMTIREIKGGFKGLKVVIAGDVLHSRVVRSNIWGLQKMGADVTVCGPATLLPVGLETLGVGVSTDIREAASGADVLMGLRIQLERQKSGMFPSAGGYLKSFGIDDEIVALAKPDAIVMHPGPVNRGVELSSEVMDGKKSVIFDQVTNGVAVRMAVLELYCGRD